MLGQLRFCSLKGNLLATIHLLSFLRFFSKHLLSSYLISAPHCAEHREVAAGHDQGNKGNTFFFWGGVP